MCAPRRQDAAQLVGQRIAELCLAKDIGQVSFDRGGNIYHGRVKVRQLAFVLSSLENIRLCFVAVEQTDVR